jgi:MoaA/NifB/PqqE/SkfB family radical SAM enzyme
MSKVDSSQIDRQKYHEDLVKYADKAFEKDDFPKRYCFILTNLCNLACTFCFQERKKKHDAMTKDEWLDVIDSLPVGSRITLTGGEPVVFRGFKEIFQRACEKFEVNIITNGILLTEELINFMLQFENFKVLSVSIDNRNNSIRKIANLKEKNWDQKWGHVEKMMAYFQMKKKEVGHTCTLDSKTTILDENAKDLFDIHLYCLEDLNCDTHAFQFLKGHPIQHADIMFKKEDIFSKHDAHIYKDFDSIVSELKKVKEYNIKNKRWGFLHPSASSIMDPAEEFNIDLMNKKDLDRKAFKPCKAPWQSVHINTDGNVFPCMAIPMGNIREGYDRVFNGQRFKEFRDIIRNEGLVEGCNRCGWLKPINEK